MKNYDLSVIEHISIDQLYDYLQQSGWTKVKEKDGYASLWKKDDEDPIFIPLDPSFDDYKSRLLQVFITLERIEKREYKDIVQSLNHVTKIAHEKHRNVLDIVLKSLDGNKNEVNAKKVGSFLKNLQLLIDSIAESSNVNLPHELSVLSTFHGSFGIRLATPIEEEKQLSLMETETSLEEFIDLIQISSSDEDELLKRKLSFLSQKSIKFFKNFTGSLVELNANVFFKLGVLDKDKDINADISYVRAANILQIIKEKEETKKELLEVFGKLVLAGTGSTIKERKFIFTDGSDENKIYEGIISEDLLIEVNHKIEAGNYYRAMIEKTIFINSTSNSEETKFRLCELNKIT